MMSAVQFIVSLRHHLPRPIVLALAFMYVVLMNVAATIIVWIPPLRRLVIAKMERSNASSEQPVTAESQLLSLPGVETVRTCMSAFSCKIYDDINHGDPAPDVNVVSLDGEVHRLLDFQKPARTLVVKFGSYS